jgi:hypothetical protein
MITCLVFAGLLSITSQSGGMTRLNINPLGLNILEISTPIANATIWKLVYGIAIIISLMSYLFLDFTVFFPKRVSMQVFFDREGIRMALKKVFSSKELKALNVPDDFETYHSEYYAKLDNVLLTDLKREAFFTLNDGIIHSAGSTTFFVEKLRGIHRYHIIESNGILKHVKEIANLGPSEFISFFEKVDSEYDYISLVLSDLIRGRVIIAPQFKQILAEHYNSDKIVFHHVLHGITKIYLFPLPMYSWTIYFYKNAAGLIPIGYAIYN